MEEDAPSSMKIEIIEQNADVVEESDNVEKIFNRFDEILNTLTLYKNNISALINDVKTLEKETKKELKGMKREIQKRKSNKKPSGFATPTRISKELCEFMNVDEGTKKARTEVTQYLINYINDNDLQNLTNRRQINPDEKLKSLLALEESDKVDYFNLQKYMNKHFSKE